LVPIIIKMYFISLAPFEVTALVRRHGVVGANPGFSTSLDVFLRLPARTRPTVTPRSITRGLAMMRPTGTIASLPSTFG
jgi:hypothetical protein